MFKKMIIAMSLLSCIIVGSVEAQKITPVSTQCYWAYTIPYIALDNGGDLGRYLATDQIIDELQSFGVIGLVSTEVAGGKAFTCVVAGRITREEQIAIKRLLITHGRGTLVASDQHIKDTFNQPIFTPFRLENGEIQYQDGLYGRPLETRPAPGIAGYEEFLKSVQRWKSMCWLADREPPAGCDADNYQP